MWIPSTNISRVMIFTIIVTIIKTDLQNRRDTKNVKDSSKKGSYHDSVVLMLLTNKISAIEGVKKVSIMMATLLTKTFSNKVGLILKS